MSDFRPTTHVVICADAAHGRPNGGFTEARGTPGIPVTWLTTPDAIEKTRDPGENLALDLRTDRAVCESRSALRDAIRRCRQTAPTLDTLACHGQLSAACRELLVQEGVRVALVPKLDGQARGGRRPAPRGWPCRSLTWGLWEVGGQPARAPSMGTWLSAAWTTGPAIPRGGLCLLVADGARAPEHLRVWTVWAGRLAERGRARAIRLCELPDAIAREGGAGLGGSVLRAA